MHLFFFPRQNVAIIAKSWRGVPDTPRQLSAGFCALLRLAEFGLVLVQQIAVVVALVLVAALR